MKENNPMPMVVGGVEYTPEALEKLSMIYKGGGESSRLAGGLLRPFLLFTCKILSSLLAIPNDVYTEVTHSMIRENVARTKHEVFAKTMPLLTREAVAEAFFTAYGARFDELTPDEAIRITKEANA